MSHQTIELIVRGVLKHCGEILLCQNRKHGHVFLPGGHIDFGETAAIALAREMREELGADLKVGRFVGVCEASFDQPTKTGGSKRHHEINVVFELKSPGPDFDPSTLISQEDHIQFIWRSVQSLAEPAARLLPAGIVQLLSPKPAGRATRWASSFE